MGTLTNPLYGKAPGLGFAGAVQLVDSGEIAVATGDIDANDLVKAFLVKKGQIVVGALLEASDIDTNASPLIVLAVGDASDDDRFITASNIGQAGGATQTLARTGMFYEFTADTDIYVKVTTGAATAAAGTIRVGLLLVNAKV